MNPRLKEIEERKLEIKTLLDSDKEVDLEALETEVRELNEEKTKIEKRASISGKIAANSITVKEIEKPATEERKATKVETVKTAKFGPNEQREFGEMLQTIKYNPNDPALKFGESKNPETRALSMGVGAAGGFTVGEQFDANIRMVQDNEAIFRPRGLFLLQKFERRIKR